MKYYYTYKGKLIDVGSRIEDSIVGSGEVIKVLRERVLVKTDEGEEKAVRWTGHTFLVHESPPFAVYDRITGKRLYTGDTLQSGAGINSISEHCMRVDSSDGAAIYWLELQANESHVEHGVEIRKHPEFEELHQLKREDVNGIPHVRSLYNRLVPAADAVMMDRYRLIADFVVNATSGCFIKRDTEDFVPVLGGKYAHKSLTVTLTAGGHINEVAYVYDIVVLRTGELVLKSESKQLRTVNGTEYVLDIPADAELLNNVWTESEAISACTGSGIRMHTNDMRRIDGQLYSTDYIRDHGRSCNNCSRYFFGSGRTCDSCAIDEVYRIKGYSNRDACYFRPEKDVPLKFGIELEVGCDKGFKRTACAKVAIDTINKFTAASEYIVLKEDGSLSECSGFEIVTRPDAPEVHKRIFGDILSEAEIRKHMSSWSNGKCGIHIHVSRAPLTELWIGRMLVFINSGTMAPLIQRVAGRGSSSYTEYKKKKLSDGKECNLSEDRYEALNVSGGHTVEFRIFRGNLNPDGFIKNIEFVEAVLDYCRPVKGEIMMRQRELENPDSFTRFVNKSTKYPTLDRFLNA